MMLGPVAELWPSFPQENPPAALPQIQPSTTLSTLPVAGSLRRCPLPANTALKTLLAVGQDASWARIENRAPGPFKVPQCRKCRPAAPADPATAKPRPNATTAAMAVPRMLRNRVCLVITGPLVVSAPAPNVTD